MPISLRKVINQMGIDGIWSIKMEKHRISWYIFNITSIVSILLTIQVILNFVLRNHVKSLYMPISLWNVINQMGIDGIWNIKVGKHRISWYIFNITSIVSILLTIQVILNLVLRNHVKSLYMPISLWNMINQMGIDGIWNIKFEKHRISSYIFNITSIVSILLTIQVILNLVLRNHVKSLYMPISLWNVIKLMGIDGIWNI